MPRTAKYMNERIRTVLQRNNVPAKLYLCRRYHGWDENRAATTPVDKKRYHPTNKYKIWWYDEEPSQRTRSWCNNGYIFYELNLMFNIAPFDGDWKDSLMECGK